MTLPRRLLTVAVPLLVAVESAAQGSPVDTVPRELADAILTATSLTGVGAIRVGQTLPGFPEDVLPPGSVVLGSMLHGVTAIIVARIPYPTAFASDSIIAHLRRAGWSNPTAERDTRGFVATAASAGRPRGWNSLCRDEHTILLRLSQSSVDTTMLSVTHSRGSESACGAVLMSTVMRNSGMPQLLPHPAVRVTRQTSGSGSNDFRSSAEAATTMPPAELLRHYSAEMARAGWRAADSAAAAGLATGSYQRLDADGQVWTSTITITAMPGGGNLALLLWGQRWR